MCRIVILTTACLLAILMSAASRPSCGMEQVRIGGTGGLLAVMREVASDFEKTHPGISITVLPSMGSSGGIKAVLANALDIGLSSRNVTEQEQPAVSLFYARSPFVFAVAKNNQVSGFTISELEDIYERRTENWPGGRPIRLILRPGAEFDTTLMKSMSGRMDRAITAALGRQGMIVAITDQDSADAIEKIPYALGTITLGQMISEKRPFKALSLNGVKPDLKNMVEGRYPYFKFYYLVTRPDPGKTAQKFLDHACSDRGRKILARAGYQALSR